MCPSAHHTCEERHLSTAKALSSHTLLSQPSQVVSSTLTDTTTPSAPPRRACVDGAVADWDALEALLSRTLYSDCGWVAGEEGCLLAVEPVATPRRDRERWAQLAFEKFNVAGFFALDAPVAALYAVGRPSGTVIDVGHDKTDVAVVLDGGVVPGSVTRLASGGRVAEEVLSARLAARGVSLVGLDPVALRAAKQAIASVRPSRAEAVKGMGEEGPSSSTLTLPDGTSVPLTPADGAAAGEVLASPADGASVRPSLAGLDSLAELALAAVAAAGGEAAAVGTTASATALAARRSAAETFVLCGGGARVPGLAARLAADVCASLPAWAPSPPTWSEAPSYLPPDACSALATWTGGAVAARVVFVQNQHASRADYDEMGPVAIFRRGAGG